MRREHSFVKRVAWEPENDKPGYMDAFDEIVTGRVDSVHIERMADNQYWMAISKGDRRQVVVLTIEKRKIVARTEADE